MAKDLEYYLAQARRISEHREAGAEKEIRKLYKSMLGDLQQFMSQTYVQYAQDDKLTFAMLQQQGYNARFLEEIERQLNISTPKAAKELRALVEDTYKAAYEGMVQGVAKASQVPLDKTFAKSLAITPEQIKAAVENPVSGLTLTDRLEKNRKEIIYNIKQAVGVGLMNGDRYTTMAKRIAEHVDGDYKKAIRIARTEAHRVREAGHIEAAIKVDEEMQNGTTGMRLVKTWRSMKDERVRPNRRYKTKSGWKTSKSKGPENHVLMNEQVRLADEPFDMGHHGITAMAPGQSGNAGDDINCRCKASYEMMTDEEYFKKTGKHFAVTPERQALQQEKNLLDEQSTLETERDAAQAEMQQLDAEQFYNIWKNPVSAKDYDQLKDRLDAKRDYFKAHGQQDMLDRCDEFEAKGKKYLLAKGKFDDAAKRLDDVAEELKETRLKLMKARGIDPKKMQDEITDLQKQIAALQGSGSSKKLSLNTKVKNYDKEQLKQAFKAVDPAYYDDTWLASLIPGYADDTVKSMIENEFFGSNSANATTFKQTLKKLSSQANIDQNEIARLQGLLKTKEDDLATIMQRYGLAEDKFTQKRKDAAYWFTGYDAKERADKVLRPDTGALWKAATKEERYAAYKYTSGSGSFNRPLRGYQGSWYNFKGVGQVSLDYEGSGDDIKRLTDLIDRNPSKFDIWLQRGVESDSGAAGFFGIDEKLLRASEDELRQLLVGKVVKDEAFTSTAGAKGQGFSGSLILNIYAPKGTKYIYCEPFSHYGQGAKLNWDGISEQSSFGYEFEVLLQRGTRYKITKIEKSGGTIYADVDIVGQ